MEKEFVKYTEALALKELGFDEPCFGYYAGDILCTGQPQEIHLDKDGNYKKTKTESYHIIAAPTFSQAIIFLYICSNKQIDIELKGSDTYEERIRKIEQGCKDLRNLQNNKSN